MSAIVHVILDEPQTGVWNMAVDEALLEESLRSEVVFLRFYRWSEPTVSFGYFQSDEDLRHHPRLSKLPRVRRLSGGGAILHHHEQTYSCSLPPTHRLAQQPYQLYVEIHASFVAFLAEWGVQVTVRGSTSAPRKEPFLCFLREAGPDLVVRGHKILGSTSGGGAEQCCNTAASCSGPRNTLPTCLGFANWFRTLLTHALNGDWPLTTWHAAWVIQLS